MQEFPNVSVLCEMKRNTRIKASLSMQFGCRPAARSLRTSEMYDKYLKIRKYIQKCSY